MCRAHYSDIVYLAQAKGDEQMHLTNEYHLLGLNDHADCMGRHTLHMHVTAQIVAYFYIYSVFQ